MRRSHILGCAHYVFWCLGSFFDSHWQPPPNNNSWVYWSIRLKDMHVWTSFSVTVELETRERREDLLHNSFWKCSEHMRHSCTMLPLLKQERWECRKSCEAFGRLHHESFLLTCCSPVMSDLFFIIKAVTFIVFILLSKNTQSFAARIFWIFLASCRLLVLWLFCTNKKKQKTGVWVWKWRNIWSFGFCRRGSVEQMLLCRNLM